MLSHLSGAVISERLKPIALAIIRGVEPDRFLCFGLRADLPLYHYTVGLAEGNIYYKSIYSYKKKEHHICVSTVS